MIGSDLLGCNLSLVAAATVALLAPQRPGFNDHVVSAVAYAGPSPRSADNCVIPRRLGLDDQSTESLPSEVECGWHLYVKTASVRVLDRSRRPTNVSGFVVPIVVDPIDRMAQRWSAADVLDEALERVDPARVNRDASPAVVGVTTLLWVQAARLHRNPSPVLRPRGSAVFRLVPKASARPYVATLEAWGGDTRAGSTVALTNPDDLSAGTAFVGRRHCQQPPEPLPSELVCVISHV